MRLASHECRWFFAGALGEDDEIVDRFRSAGDWKKRAAVPPPAWPEDWREDRYEVLPRGVPPREIDLGIKLRDERPYGRPLRLEYKARTSSLGPVRLSESATGVVERWIKWSYSGESVPHSLWRPFEVGEIGIAVRKKRILRKLRLDAFDHDEEVPLVGPDSFVDRGMGIELTRLRLVDHGWHWTLGLEAFPHDTEIPEDFLRNAERFLSDFAGAADLSLGNSMSYPEWLGRLFGETHPDDSLGA